MTMADIGSMSWEHLERTLRMLRRRSAEERAFVEYFGADRLDRLLSTVRRGISRRASPVLRVLFVPGMMGSRLIAASRARGAGVVWVHLPRLMNGGLERLALADDGRGERNPGREVRADGIEKRVYAQAVLSLRSRCPVEVFPFDWRLSMVRSADALADLLRVRSGAGPLHLVAHSMGGLVCRLMVARHPRLWRRTGGRLIMIGTPQRGSYAAVQALTGEEETVRLLAMLDLRHTRAELLDIIAGFPSAYELLPFYSSLDVECARIYGRPAWGRLPIVQRHLDAARRVQRILSRSSAVDPDRMYCIAGTGRPTITGFRLADGERFLFTLTSRGDGTVPVERAGLDGVDSFFVDANHADLPSHDRVLEAILDLAGSGQTGALPAHAPESPDDDPPVLLRRRVGAQDARAAELARIVRDLAGPGAKPALAAEGERILLSAAAGGPGHEAGGFPRQARATNRRALRVRVVCADVRDVRTPLIVVGHYAGVPPVRAIGAIDAALDNWITAAMKRSALPGSFGQMSFLPVRRGHLRASTVLVAGMGGEGLLTDEDLRSLMAVIVGAATGLGFQDIATVLIGSGHLGPERAAAALLAGCREPAREQGGAAALRSLTLVEHDPSRARLLAGLLPRLIDREHAGRIRYVAARREPMRGHRGAAGSPRRETPADAFGVRLAVERRGDRYRYSLMTSGATIPVREVEVQGALRDRLCGDLVRAADAASRRRGARLLGRLLLPEEFRRMFRPGRPVTLIVDSSTCAIPWEMLALSESGRTALGLESPVIRQLRSSMPGEVALRHSAGGVLRVLIIADPAPESDLRLPGAAREGRLVTEMLRRARRMDGRPLEVTARIGPDECDPAELVRLLVDGDFDCVHYAGHGVFSDGTPSHGGWLFGRTRRGVPVTLSAREMFRARSTPKLVFANACFSLRVQERWHTFPGKPQERVAGLAEAFLSRGVGHYIGTGWEIADDIAVACARAFYSSLLRGKCTIAQALFECRRGMSRRTTGWGAYHHYGNCRERL